MASDARTLIEILREIIGDVPYGYDFIYFLAAVLLLVFMFHLLEHLFEVLFSRFYKQ